MPADYTNPFSKRSVIRSAQRGGLGWTLAGLLLLFAIIKTLLISKI